MEKKTLKDVPPEKLQELADLEHKISNYDSDIFALEKRGWNHIRVAINKFENNFFDITDVVPIDYKRKIFDSYLIEIKQNRDKAMEDYKKCLGEVITAHFIGGNIPFDVIIK